MINLDQLTYVDDNNQLWYVVDILREEKCIKSFKNKKIRTIRKDVYKWIWNNLKGVAIWNIKIFKGCGR